MEQPYAYKTSTSKESSEPLVFCYKSALGNKKEKLYHLKNPTRLSGQLNVEGIWNGFWYLLSKYISAMVLERKIRLVEGLLVNTSQSYFDLMLSFLHAATL